jgi:O-antigen ligase
VSEAAEGRAAKAGSFGRGCAAALLAGTLVLPFVGGYPLAYLLMLASLLLIGWWLASRPGRAELAEPGGLMALAGFGLIAVALLVTADAAGDALYAVNFLMLALYPLLRAAMARLASPRGSSRVALLAFCGTCLALLVALWQVFGEGAGRARGFGSDPIWAAQAALILGFLPLMGLQRGAASWRAVYLLGPVLALVTVLLTGSRGPLIAALPLLAVAVLLAPGHRRTIAAMVIIAGIAGAAIIVLGAPGEMARVQSMVTAALQSMSGGDISEASIGVRAAIYRSSWAAFLDAPLFGHGWEERLPASYAQVPGGEAAIEAMDPVMHGNHHLHADVLDLGVGAGLFGLVAYGLALLAPLASALSAPADGQRTARVLGASLLATSYLGCGLTYIMFGYEFPTTLYVCLAAILAGYCRDAPTSSGAGRASRPWPLRRSP